MSSQQGKWREEQVLIICPGSQTTLAQMGCAELTPPPHRFPTRVFKDEDSNDWRPYHTYKRKKESAAVTSVANGDTGKTDEDDWEYVEDPDSAEGAVYPIQAGRIVNMEALLAFLDHVHSSLTTTYHNTPIVLMASPQWTRPDCEAIAQYIFEKTRTPALCLIHSAVATQYGLKWPNLTVVDVGFEKVDVTCIYDSRVVSHRDVGSYPDPDSCEEGISGGEVFTRKLLGLLKKKGFNYDMAEQLKKSPVCEVLPYVPESPNLADLPLEEHVPGSAGGAQNDGSRAPDAAGDDDGINGEGGAIEDEGVLDVANIVASGQTREFLAKKEKEKAEKGKPGRRGKDKDEAPVRASKLPNSKRAKNVFHFEEFVTEEVPAVPVEMPPPPRPVPAPAQVPTAEPATAPRTESNADAGEQSAPKPTAESAPGQNDTAKDVEMGDATAAGSATGPDPAASAEGSSSIPASRDAPSDDAVKPEPSTDPASGSAPAAAAPPAETSTTTQIKRVRRDVEVGLERFTFAERAEIDRIVTTIYRAVQGIEDMYMRPQCWENIVFVGNGSRIRGLKENIMQTLQSRHLVSPSSATMFTSELPSNLGTPSGTGSQTPTGSFTGAPHLLPTSSNVNPLLQAATTANMGVPGGANTGPGSNAGDPANGTSHHFHSQTPTAIKLAQLPTYLSEWTKNGFEEAMFLGAQVAARLAYTIHNLDAVGAESQRFLSLNRVEYNELGPKGIRTHSMLD